MKEAHAGGGTARRNRRHSLENAPSPRRLRRGSGGACPSSPRRAPVSILRSARRRTRCTTAESPNLSAGMASTDIAPRDAGQGVSRPARRCSAADARPGLPICLVMGGYGHARGAKCLGADREVVGSSVTVMRLSIERGGVASSSSGTTSRTTCVRRRRRRDGPRIREIHMPRSPRRRTIY